MNLEGQQFGEFTILECIGQGGMGAVYKASQTSLDRLVALKTLQASLAEDTEYIARFRHEAKAAAKLTHPNLVQVYSAGETDGLQWFAMEYVEGESAKTRLLREGRLDPLEAIAIIIHIASALEYGWNRAQLIHRDIKPDNIFLSAEGEVKLGDLGLAKSAGQTQGLTESGQSMGTPHYISPEQVQSMKEVDFRADIYSLGCTLFHFVSGQTPYEGHSAVTIMMQHVSAPVPDLPHAWPECPPELAAVVLKMILKAPDTRYQSYGEMIAELRRVYDQLSGQSIPPAAVTPATGSGDFQSPTALPKSQAPLYAGLAVVILALAATAFFLVPKLQLGNALGPGSSASSASHQAGASPTPAFPSQSSGAKEHPPATDRMLAVASTPAPTPAPVPVTPSTPAPAPPSASATPAPATPAPATPVPAATPSPLNEMEKWLALVDAPQQEAYQKQVVAPFESGVAGLRSRYLAALDADVAKASRAGQLAEALLWRTEKQNFEKTQNVTPDEAETPAAVKTLRASYRQELVKLDQDRLTQAKALQSQYDAVLAKTQTLLTQRQRLDEALLLQTKREEIARAWLAPSPLLSASGAETKAATPTAKTTMPPAPSAQSGAVPAATKDAPFVNTLGMKFVPVPIHGGPTAGQRVLFAVWDVRVQDYTAYAEANPEVDGAWKKQDRDGVPCGREPDHPVVSVSWEDAQAFCQWLTAKEQAEGKLPKGVQYRLPTDEEWSWAVGMPPEVGSTPAEKSEKNSVDFPWGKNYPPVKKVGNYADETFHATFPKPNAKTQMKGWLEGYNDGYATTLPVGSFPANAYGLYDMGGNVWQWCEDWFDASHNDRVLRGASWTYYVRGHLLSSNRNHSPPTDRRYVSGLRCVLAPGTTAPTAAPTTPAAPLLTATTPLPTATKEAPFINTFGMKFMPVSIHGGPTAGQRVLFAVWDVRVQDYTAYANANPQVDGAWKTQNKDGVPCGREPDHPVVGVSWEDAQAFCQWLTAKEQAEGKLPKGVQYRLPSDEEWSWAVGMPAEVGSTPAEKSGKNSVDFPWGKNYPPVKKVGNYADETFHATFPKPNAKTQMNGWIEGYNDGYATTSPVGSFPANAYGLYDMSGNVWQFCEDWWDATHQDRVLRGASSDLYDRYNLLSSYRGHYAYPAIAAAPSASDVSWVRPRARLAASWRSPACVLTLAS